MEGISSTHDPSNILIDVVRNKLNQKGRESEKMTSGSWSVF